MQTEKEAELTQVLSDINAANQVIKTGVATLNDKLASVEKQLSDLQAQNPDLTDEIALAKSDLADAQSIAGGFNIPDVPTGAGDAGDATGGDAGAGDAGSENGGGDNGGVLSDTPTDTGDASGGNTAVEGNAPIDENQNPVNENPTGGGGLL